MLTHQPLTDQQVLDLRQHLSDVVPPTDLDRVVQVINISYTEARLEMQLRPDPRDRDAQAVQEHATQVIRLVEPFRDLVSVTTKPDTVSERDWTVFLRTLDHVKTSALSDLARTRRTRGRRPTEWRDWLIVNVYGATGGQGGEDG